MGASPIARPILYLFEEYTLIKEYGMKICYRAANQNNIKRTIKTSGNRFRYYNQTN